MLGRFLKKATMYVLAFLLPIVIIEGAAKLYYLVKLGRYEAASELMQGQTNTFMAMLEDADRNCSYSKSLFPHPYLGFVHHNIPPCGFKFINSYGLFGDPYPVERDEEHFTILLAGGSIASQLGQEGGPNAPNFLEIALNERYVSPTGKPFKVFNGGDGAWKYPQQLILYAMFAPQLDAVVTLDGPIEFYYYYDGVHKRLETPASNFNIANPFVNNGMGEMAEGWLLEQTRLFIERTPLIRQSHIVFFFYDAVRRPYVQAAATETSARNSFAQGMFALPADWSDARLRSWNLQRYQDYIREMDAIAHRFRARDAFFVAPVPAIGRKLTPEELKVVGPLDYGPDYQAMTDHLLRLRDESVPIFSLLQVFADVSAPIYGDTGHPRGMDGSEDGYFIMADRMADDIAAAWSLQKRPTPLHLWTRNAEKKATAAQK